jgi:hypothetical protein
MQDALLQPSQPPALSLSSFFTALIRSLEKEGLRPCVLRNYQGFPASNVGRDIDFLISPSQLPRAIRALRSIEGVRIIGYLERSSVAEVYLQGISAVPGVRGLEVDFDLSLAWKGMPFLTIDAVLQAAVPRPAGGLTFFFVPSPVHEAVISLFASLLVGGWLKEKYFPDVQRTFAGSRFEVIGALQPQFGRKSATRLVDSVIGGDREKILGCVGTLRFSLALRSLLRRPVRSILTFVRHYTSELAVRFSPETLENVCILGPEGCGNATTTEALMPMLQCSAASVEKRHHTPQLFKSQLPGDSQRGDSSATTRVGSLSSMARIVRWLMRDWLDQFAARKHFTLRISETCYEDLLIDPVKYRYGGPMWFARLAGKFFPSPDLWIMLDPAPEGLPARNHDVLSERNRSQLQAYRAFARTRKRYVILDAGQSADRITEAAYSAIVDTLAERALKTLKSRF